MKLRIQNFRPFFSLLAGLAALLCVGVAPAATLAPGRAFPLLAGLRDQHEQAYPMPRGVRHVAVAFTMGEGKDANGYFSRQEADFLSSRQSIFVANIYGMPAVGRFFAMPKMKKYPHRIMLADEAGLLDDFPRQDGKVTVFDLDPDGTIEVIRYWDPASNENPF